MRQPMMTGTQAGMMGIVTVPPNATSGYVMQQQNNTLSTEHQNGNSNNVQLDPFGAF